MGGHLAGFWAPINWEPSVDGKLSSSRTLIYHIQQKTTTKSSNTIRKQPETTQQPSKTKKHPKKSKNHPSKKRLNKKHSKAKKHIFKKTTSAPPPWQTTFGRRFRFHLCLGLRLRPRRPRAAEAAGSGGGSGASGDGPGFGSKEPPRVGGTDKGTNHTHLSLGIVSILEGIQINQNECV